MAIVTAASTLSWLPSFGGTQNETTKIILKEDVEYLGKKGQLLDVKAGEMKMEDERIEAEKQRVKEEAQQLAVMFETIGAFKVKRKGGKVKQIFGSVTAQDLVDIIKAQLQRDVDKRIVSSIDKGNRRIYCRAEAPP
ncbi:hypothetical protein CRYUN_Cryun11dG0117200 [Craigia yunnanensis]